jgi:DNA-binding GntR family transcriptional regulator
MAAKRTSPKKAIPAKIGDSIRELIARGTLAPGVHLGQMELAKRFGSSRVPVREALKLLTAEGVVLHDPNRGFFIAKLSSEEARQLYRMRHLLEVELLGTVEWPDKGQLVVFQTQLDKLEAYLRAGKSSEWVEQYREFHTSIFNLSPQKVIVEEVLRLARLTDRYRAIAPLQLALSERTVEPERHLVLALATRDRKRLIRGFEEDRARVQKHVFSTLEARNL